MNPAARSQASSEPRSYPEEPQTFHFPSRLGHAVSTVGNPLTASIKYAAKEGRQKFWRDVGVGGPGGNPRYRAAEDGDCGLTRRLAGNRGANVVAASSKGVGTDDDGLWRTSMPTSSTRSRRGSMPGWRLIARDCESLAMRVFVRRTG